MEIMLAGFGVTLGAAAMIPVCYVFRVVRQKTPMLAAVPGWIYLALAVNAVFFHLLSTRIRPTAVTAAQTAYTPLWDVIVSMVALLLLVCAGIALIHRRCYRLSWFEAYGVLILEALFAVIVGAIVGDLFNSIVDFRVIISVYVGMAIGFVLLEAGSPFLAKGKQESQGIG